MTLAPVVGTAHVSFIVLVVIVEESVPGTPGTTAAAPKTTGTSLDAALVPAALCARTRK